MHASRLSLLALMGGLFSFILLLPFPFGRWLGLVFAVLGVSCGRFGKPKGKKQEVFCLLGMLLPPLACLLYFLLYFF